MIKYITIVTLFFFQKGCLSIYDGSPIPQEEAPFMSSIYRLNPLTRNLQYICVGVIVRPRYMATAASCVNEFIDTSLLIAYVNDIVRGTGNMVQVIGITLDEETNGLDKDIALLKLAGQIEVPGRIAPIMLPPTDLAINGSKITIIGYTHSEIDGVAVNVVSRILTYDIIYYRNIGLPRYSFLAMNRFDGRGHLDDDDRGSPALINGYLVGLLISTSNNMRSPKFVNIYGVMEFITHNL